MIVSFNTQALRDCCANLEKAEAAIGSAHAQELMSVLSDAEAADTATEFIELYRSDVTVDGDSISLLIGTRYRLSFVALGVALLRDREGGLEWSAVRRLKMMDLSKC